MTYENNRKYLAETWIDNREDEEFKKSFLKGLIEEWQGDGKGFDADKLDGKHYRDILDDIDDAVEGVMKDFYIGEQLFSASNLTNKYVIDFDAIQLFLESEDYQGHKVLPWDSLDKEYGGDGQDPIPTLYDALQLLYAFILTKLDTETFNESLPSIEQINNFFNRFVDGNNELNASTVNGLRFFIVSEEKYEEMAIQEPEKVQNIHNIFIIKTQQEMEDAGYESGYYDLNPDIATFDKEYQFRVVPLTITEYEDGVILGESTNNWLQYRYSEKDLEEGGGWKNICKTEDFIDTILLENVLKNILQGNDYEINDEVFSNALERLQISDSSNYPWTQYNKNTYIKGAFHIENNEREFVPISPLNGFNYLNLTNLYEDLTDYTDDVLSQLNEYKDTVNNNINSLTLNINANSNEINRIIGDESTITLSSLNQSISTLNENINSLRADINQIKQWDVKYIGGLYYPVSPTNLDVWKNWIEKGDIRPSTQNINKTVSCVYTNERLGLGILYLNFLHYHKGSNANKWVAPSVAYSKNGINYYYPWSQYANQIYGSKPAGTQDINNLWKDTVPEKPLSNIIFDSIEHTDTKIRIRPTTDGNYSEILIRSTKTSDFIFHVYNHYIFKLL